MTSPQPESSPSTGGSFFTRKAGPLPMWAWIGLAVGVLLAVMGLRGKSSTPASDPADALPDNLDPTAVYQFYDQDQTYITMPQAPPAGGRPPTPPTPIGQPVGPRPPVTMPKPPTVPPKPPVTAPKPPTPPPPPSGSWITTIAYKSGQPKGTPSTLWGMAEQAYGNGTQWSRIWSAPQNAALVAKRGAANKIQPGDRFWVPK